MPAQNLNPYDASPPRRPDIDSDLGSAVCENAGAAPDNTFPNADWDNTDKRLGASHGRVVPFNILTIDGAIVAIVGIASLRAGYTLLDHPYTLIRYPFGDAHGDFALGWDPSDDMPPPTIDAEAFITGGADCYATTELTQPNVLRIRTRLRATGAGTDCRVQVHHY